MSVIEFDQALEMVMSFATNLPAQASERLPLLDVLGRILAEPVRADRDQPPFARSTRDGFAVTAATFGGGGTVQVVGQVRAGQRWLGPQLAPGQAVRIMTGAPIPEGADSVAMVEFVEHMDRGLRTLPNRTLRVGENVVPRGSEALAGATVVPAGVRMDAAEIAVAAACGCSEVTVFRKPSVAIVATGDELVELASGVIPGEAEIWNSNTYALAALVTEAGGWPERIAIARDLREDLDARIAQGRAASLLVLSGGVSKGDYDLVEEVLAEQEAEFFFTGVKMQPGKPVVFGRLPARDGLPACFFFGLPGNPISTQVTFHCFVEPLLRAMAGGEPAGPRFVQATLNAGVAGKPGIMRLLPARLIHRRERPGVSLVDWQGSGDLAANARANCYAVLPPERETFEAGDVISVMLR